MCTGNTSKSESAAAIHRLDGKRSEHCLNPGLGATGSQHYPQHPASAASGSKIPSTPRDSAAAQIQTSCSDLQLRMLKGSLGTAVEQWRGCNRGGCWREGGRKLCALDSSGRHNGRGTRLKGSRTKDRSNGKAWQKGGTSEGSDIEGVLKEAFEKKAACTSQSN